MDAYIFYAFGAGLFIVLISLIGRLTAIGIFHTLVTRHLSILTSFSAGVFLVIALGLLFEAVQKVGSAYLVFAIVVIGFIVISLVFRLIPEAHHHHSGEEKDRHSLQSARKLLLVDILHNAGDGLVLGSVFLIDISFGFVVTLSIAIHEAIQEISEYFVLRQAGYSVGRALFLNFLVSLSIFVGIIAGIVLGNIKYVEGIVIAFASGALLHIVFEDMFPNSIRAVSDKRSAVFHILSAFLGISLMLFLLFFSGHNS